MPPPINWSPENIYKPLQPHHCGTFDTTPGSTFVRVADCAKSGDPGTYDILDCAGKVISSCGYCFRWATLELCSASDFNRHLTKKTIMSHLLQKFRSLTKGEPQKSFTKAGITDEQDNLTTEGTALLLQFLLEQNSAAFKEKVVDKLLADEKKQS